MVKVRIRVGVRGLGSGLGLVLELGLGYTVGVRFVQLAKCASRLIKRAH